MKLYGRFIYGWCIEQSHNNKIHENTQISLECSWGRYLGDSLGWMIVVCYDQKASIYATPPHLLTICFWNEIKFLWWNFSSWFSSKPTSRTNFRLKNFTDCKNDDGKVAGAEATTTTTTTTAQAENYESENSDCDSIGSYSSGKCEKWSKRSAESVSVMIIFQHTHNTFFWQDLSRRLFFSSYFWQVLMPHHNFDPLLTLIMPTSV